MTTWKLLSLLEPARIVTAVWHETGVAHVFTLGIATALCMHSFELHLPLSHFLFVLGTNGRMRPVVMAPKNLSTNITEKIEPKCNEMEIEHQKRAPEKTGRPEGNMMGCTV